MSLSRFSSSVSEFANQLLAKSFYNKGVVKRLKYLSGTLSSLLRVSPVQCTKLGAQLLDKFLENGLRTTVGGCLTTNYSWNFNCLPTAAQTVRTRRLAWDLLPPSLPPLRILDISCIFQ